MCQSKPPNETQTSATVAGAGHRRSVTPSPSSPRTAAGLKSSAQSVLRGMRSRVPPGHEHLTAAAAAAQMASHAAAQLSNSLSVAWAAEGLSLAQRKQVIEDLWTAQNYLAKVQAALAELDSYIFAPEKAP